MQQWFHKTNVNNKSLPFLPLSLTFIPDVIWYGISLWLAWVSCPCFVPSQDFAHLSPLMAGQNVTEAALMLWEHCSAAAETLVCGQHSSSYQHTAQHCEGCGGENLTPCQPDSIQILRTYFEQALWLCVLSLLLPGRKNISSKISCTCLLGPEALKEGSRNTLTSIYLASGILGTGYLHLLSLASGSSSSSL